MALLPCSACKRHVRLDERACPFCGNDLGSRAPHTIAMPRGSSRLARIALWTAALSVSGTALVACSDDDDQTVPVYGAPADSGQGSDGGDASTD